MRAKTLAEEKGFTLPEVLVTMLIMMTVLFALYSIFDMSIRVFGYGNDKVEAVENARLGLERMEREIRAAYPYDKTNPTSPDPGLFAEWTSTRLTFGNDLDGSRKIECPAAEPSACEVITYDVYKPSGRPTYALGRANSAAGVRRSVVEFVDYKNTANTGLKLTYLKNDGVTEVVPGSGAEKDIAMVKIELKIAVDRSVGDGPVTQVLSTDVALRNRSN